MTSNGNHSLSLSASMDSDRSPLLKTKRNSVDSQHSSIGSIQSPLEVDFRSKVKLDPSIKRVEFFHSNKRALFYFCGLLTIAVVFFSLLTVGAIVMPGQYRSNSGDIVHTRVMWKQKGITFTTGKYCPLYDSQKAETSLANLMTTGASHVGLVVNMYQDYYDSTYLYTVNDQATEIELGYVTMKLQAMGAKVFLMPQILLNKDPTHSRVDIGKTFSEKEFNLWFKNYTTIIQKYAFLAASHNIDIFSVGCELNATSKYDKAWRELIEGVKYNLKHYGDPNFMSNVTYQSSIGGEETHKTWWDDLDYIGINAKYPMNGDTLDSLVQNWAVIQMGLMNISSKFNKTVLFTEVEYCSGTCYATVDRKVDLSYQTMRYQALFTAFRKTPWLEGAYFSKWLTDPSFGGIYNVCPSPQFKPAEDTLRSWYGGQKNSTLPPYPPECPCIM